MEGNTKHAKIGKLEKGDVDNLSISVEKWKFSCSHQLLATVPRKKNDNLIFFDKKAL